MLFESFSLGRGEPHTLQKFVVQSPTGLLHDFIESRPLSQLKNWLDAMMIGMPPAPTDFRQIEQ